MLSSVLRSRRAVAVNIEIMRTFVRLRKLVAAHKDLAIQLAKLEQSVAIHDEQIQAVLSAIRQAFAFKFEIRNPKSKFSRCRPIDIGP